MIISRCIRGSANGIISCFLMAEKYSMVYMYHVLFILSAVDGHLSCLHVLAVVNSAAMNIGVHVSFQINVFIFCGYIHRSGIFESYNCSIFSLWRNPASTVVASIYIPTNNVQRFPFVHILTNILICCLLHDSHSGRCEAIPHCGFDLHFFYDKRFWASFLVPVGHL